MSTQQFYPACFGMSKLEAISLLRGHLVDGSIHGTKLKMYVPIDWLQVLDDATMAAFVNDYYQPVYDYIGEDMPDTLAHRMKEAVQNLCDAIATKLA